jgi:site-specific DNA-methyltransferase (adenine-specific)
MESTIILGDNRHELYSLDSESVDLVCTSPPYKQENGFSHSLINEVFCEVHRIMKKGSLLFFNFGHLADDKSRPFKVVLQLEKIFGPLRETFVWVKGQYKPIQGKRRVNNVSEFIFMFCKGNMPELDRLAIGVPYQDKSNIGRYSNQDLKCASNVWFINYETITSSGQKLHNDRFPIELPTRCIKLANLKPGSIILDPFFGSGSTGVAANQLKHYFVGIEIDKNYYNIAKKRLQGVASSNLTNL